MTSFKDLVERAADKADLSISNAVAANGLSLLVHTMIECGKPKLPHGSIPILSEVLKERTGHRVTGGSLRWYRVMLDKDPEFVARFITLPAAYETLVRGSAPTSAS